MRHAIVTFVTLLAAAPVRSAVSAGPEAPVVASLAVTGPSDCAGRAEVMKLIARRSTRIRFGDGAAARPALRVAVEGAPPRAVAAALAIAWPDGSRSERRLSAPTCSELADAIALVAVLALDPASANREPPEPGARPASPPSPRADAVPPAVPPRDRPAPAPSAEDAAPPPRRPPPPADDTPAPAPAPPPPVPAEAVAQATVAPPPGVEPSTPPVHRLDVGAAFRIASGPTPSLMPGLALVAGWQRDTASVLSWKVQLVLAHHARGGWATSYGTADFTLDLVTLHLCPLRLGPQAARVRVCASAAAGRMLAEGMDTLSPRTRSRPFAGVGAAASLAVSPHPRVEVSASVEPQAMLIRDQFAFGSNLVYDVPAVVLFFGLGATLTFP